MSWSPGSGLWQRDSDSDVDVEPIVFDGPGAQDTVDSRREQNYRPGGDGSVTGEAACSGALCTHRDRLT
jgi:hypothetical protein